MGFMFRHVVEYILGREVVWCMNVWVGVAALSSFVCCLACTAFLIFDRSPPVVELETIHGASASAEGYRPLRANV